MMDLLNCNCFQVGDQILDVNGTTFLDISHAGAIQLLKSSKRLVMTVKDVGKIPYAMTTFDRTEWISAEDVNPQKNGSTWSRCLPLTL